MFYPSGKWQARSLCKHIRLLLPCMHQHAAVSQLALYLQQQKMQCQYKLKWLVPVLVLSGQLHAQRKSSLINVHLLCQQQEGTATLRGSTSQLNTATQPTHDTDLLSSWHTLKS